MPFAAWQNFYVIIGSSAGALTGLQFVVMVLVADMPVAPGTGQSVDAFGTPTVVHFGTVLLLSAVLSAPWSGVEAPTLLIGLCGAAGIVYVLIVARRARQQVEYSPVFEDWLFHVFLPAIAYAILVAAAYLARARVNQALFGIATAAVLLLFTGIHNAWDTVTYLVFVRKQGEQHDSSRRT
jgi:hypothetical protein